MIPRVVKTETDAQISRDLRTSFSRQRWRGLIGAHFWLLDVTVLSLPGVLAPEVNRAL